VQKREIEWLESMMGQETPTGCVVVGGQLTCVHHVVFVSGSVCFCCFQHNATHAAQYTDRVLTNLSHHPPLSNLCQCTPFIY